jgi:hypothetical protein
MSVIKNVLPHGCTAQAIGALDSLLTAGADAAIEFPVTASATSNANTTNTTAEVTAVNVANIATPAEVSNATAQLTGNTGGFLDNNSEVDTVITAGNTAMILATVGIMGNASATSVSGESSATAD